jgi:hypothetical protein
MAYLIARVAVIGIEGDGLEVQALDAALPAAGDDRRVAQLRTLSALSHTAAGVLTLAPNSLPG